MSTNPPGVELFILYGTQTGNSEEIAKDLAIKCEEAGITTVCQNLNWAKKSPILDVAKVLVIICSTTGNGDCPENADAFWRTIKNRSAVS